MATYRSNPLGNSKFARVDQGVDYVSPGPVGAFGPGTIMSITKGMAGGTGDIIKERLDKPVTVNGRTYNQVYYSEESPLVRAGQRVGFGQPVMKGGGNELGFLNQNGQMAPLVGGLGAGTQPTQMGNDFLAWMHQLGNGAGNAQAAPAANPRAALASALMTGNVAAPQANPTQDLIQMVMANNNALIQNSQPVGYRPF